MSSATACDTCPAPGACCKSFTLRNAHGTVTEWKDSWKADALKRVQRDKLPFLPVSFGDEKDDSKSGRVYGVVRYSCPKLLPNGRCGCYADRPSICRRYQPGTDKLCVLA